MLPGLRFFLIRFHAIAFVGSASCVSVIYIVRMHVQIHCGVAISYVHLSVPLIENAEGAGYSSDRAGLVRGGPSWVHGLQPPM